MTDEPLLTTDRAGSVADAVAQWRRHLVDLGGRNALLWYRDQPSGTLDLTTVHPAGVAKLMAGHDVRLGELVRQPAPFAEAARRARAIRDKAMELEQERGLWSCHLAIGMATWDVPSGYSRPPSAPVLLRRVRLEPVGPRGDVVLRLGDDLELNPALVAYLELERGLELDAELLVDMAHRSHGASPDPTFAELSRQCARVPGFRIRGSIVLGIFSPAKLPMVMDLGADGEHLVSHDVIAAMAGDPEALAEVQAAPPLPLPDLPLEQEHLVLDADSSQQAAVQRVLDGSHLVIAGPPGTGKSQTIVNLVAALAAEGRRVLFVAEKRAAIDAVVGRLDAVGLSELVLDAHDGQPDRAHLAQQLASTLDRVAGSWTSSAPELDDELAERRDELARHLDSMHEVREPYGVSVAEAQARVIELTAGPDSPHSRVRLRGRYLAAIPASRREAVRDELVEAATLQAWSSQGDRDPWYGARVVGVDQAARADELVTRLHESGLASHRARLHGLADAVGLRPPRTVIEADEQLDLMTRVFTTLEIFQPELFEGPLDDFVAATAPRSYRREHDLDLGQVERRRLRRQARDLLRPGTPPSDLHGVLTLAAQQRRQWREMGGPGSVPRAPVEVPAVQEEHDAFRAELDWLAARLESTVDGGDLVHTDLDDLATRLASLAGARDRLAVVPTAIGLLDRLRAAGLGEVVDDFAARRLPAEKVPAELDFIWWTSVLAEVGAKDPVYGTHDGFHLRQVAQRYVEQDRRHVDAGVARVAALVEERVRQAQEDFPEQAELIRAEAQRTRRHRTLRQMMSDAPELMTMLRPCWAMSPLVVAQAVPPGLWFDVVVFDEASQVPPAQAVSAISRATQVVVVGDPRQLPPTSFHATDGDDDSVPADMLAEGVASVLDVLGTILPEQTLTWHYRSRDERLIAFANAQVYRGGLVTFPGQGTEEVLELQVVDAEDGAELDSSDAEVQRVLDVVLEHARTRPEESLGVITLGPGHAQRIEAAVQSALSWEPDLSAYFRQHTGEPFFAKSLERVQGDERDAVVLSVGYVHRPRSDAPATFGPLSLEGGERRLNVAITRARRRMTVVSTFRGEDVDVTRVRARGALMLRDWLIYAEHGGSASGRADREGGERDHLPAGDAAAETSQEAGGKKRRRPRIVGGRRRLTASTGSVLDRPLVPEGPRRPDDPLVADLAERLRHKGLVVHTAHGVSAQPIDLVIEDPLRPGELIVAVETDGPVYAAMGSVRDRDRLRPEQLRRLGWHHERVWSVDIFRDPARDVARLQEVVQRVSEERAARRRAEQRTAQVQDSEAHVEGDA